MNALSWQIKIQKLIRILTQNRRGSGVPKKSLPWVSCIQNRLGTTNAGTQKWSCSAERLFPSSYGLMTEGEIEINQGKGRLALIDTNQHTEQSSVRGAVGYAESSDSLYLLIHEPTQQTSTCSFQVFIVKLSYVGELDSGSFWSVHLLNTNTTEEEQHRQLIILPPLHPHTSQDVLVQ